MKKFLALMICALVVFGCTFSAFASDATPDEIHGDVTSIEVVSVPKVAYSYTKDTGDNLTEDEWLNLREGNYDQDYIDSVRVEHFVFYLDLEGAQILATYSDGYSEYIAPYECIATVLDMPKSLEKEELFRYYTVQVEYMGCKDTYKIFLYDDTNDAPGYQEGNYRFVSYVPPTKNVYVFEECDAYPASTLYPGFGGYFFDVDKTGMSVTLLNKTTGKLEVYSEESIECSPVYVDQLWVNLKWGGNINTFGSVITNYGEIVPFDYTVKLTFKEDTTEVNPTDDPQNPENDGKDSSVSTPDSATKDNSNNKKSPTVPQNALVGNKAVNTGEVFPATVVLVIVGCLAMGTLFLYKRRESK